MFTLTIAAGPSVIPRSFTETIAGTSTGLSGALSHSAQVAVTFAITPDALVKIIDQDLAAGCIASAGFAQSLVAKVNAYQKLASAGQVPSAANLLAAFQYEVQAQIGHQIVSSSTDPIGGNVFSPGQALLADARALQAMLGTQVKASPIVGTVTNATVAGTPGASVNLRSGKSFVATTSTDAVGFYDFDPAKLTPGAQYSVDVTIPKGYKSASPASQAFTGSASPMMLGPFMLN